MNKERTNNKIIAEHDGSILNIDQERVEVVLHPDTNILFPKELFDENDVSLKFGQPLKYQIVENSKGERFQRFINRAIDNSNISKKKATLLKMLQEL